MLNSIFTRALLFALLAWPMLTTASESARHLQAIRSEAFDVCNGVLLYFNPNIDHRGGRNPHHAEEYRQSLERLGQLVGSVRDTQLATQVRKIQTLLAELERQPASVEWRYAHWLNPTLEAHADLDNRAADLYTNAPKSPDQVSLDALSLDVARLNLLYQTRTFGGLRLFISDNSSEPFKELDGRIVEGFDAAEGAWPNSQDIISTNRRNYYFVRSSLLANGANWVQGSAAYYLGKITRSLNSLSAQQRLGN